jgi:hypothetical protein
MAFDETADELKARLRAATYQRPIESIIREGRHRRRRRQGWAVAAAGVTVAVVALVVWSPVESGRMAIAGWTPTPQSADPATIAAASAVCGEMARMNDAAGGPAWPDSGGAPWVDSRGNGLLLASPGDSAVGLCLLVVVKPGGPFSHAGGAVVQLELLDGTVHVAGIVGIAADGTGVTAVVGQATPEAARVVVTAGRWIVDASIHSGYWLAWWPDATEAEDVSVVALNGKGVAIGTWSPGG